MHAKHGGRRPWPGRNPGADRTRRTPARGDRRGPADLPGRPRLVDQVADGTRTCAAKGHEQSRRDTDDQDGIVLFDSMQAGPQYGDHVRRAADTYGAAADHYTRDALSFWDRFGSATVSRLPLAPGASVLDLCCGAGASAIPAAHAVGPAGRVLGIDAAAPMVELARAEAARQGLANIEFRRGDATSTGLTDSSFDAVVCVFGVFFASDMSAFMREMWRLVRPGGVLAVTTWGTGLFEPANGHFWRCVGQVEPSLVRVFNPWDEITTPAALVDLFSHAGISDPAVEAAGGQHQPRAPGQLLGHRARIRVPGYRQRPQPCPGRPAPHGAAGRTAVARDNRGADRCRLRDREPPWPLIFRLRPCGR